MKQNVCVKLILLHCVIESRFISLDSVWMYPCNTETIVYYFDKVLVRKVGVLYWEAINADEQRFLVWQAFYRKQTSASSPAHLQGMCPALISSTEMVYVLV